MNRVLTNLLQCNSDVTPLLSGTAIKAIIAYVTDYVTKPSLKSYVIFGTIEDPLKRIEDDTDDHNAHIVLRNLSTELVENKSWGLLLPWIW